MDKIISHAIRKVGINQCLPKEFGFTDTEVARSRQDSHDMLTKFLIEQRATPDLR